MTVTIKNESDQHNKRLETYFSNKDNAIIDGSTISIGWVACANRVNTSKKPVDKLGPLINKLKNACPNLTILLIPNVTSLSFVLKKETFTALISGSSFKNLLVLELGRCKLQSLPSTETSKTLRKIKLNYQDCNKKPEKNSKSIDEEVLTEKTLPFASYTLPENFVEIGSFFKRLKLYNIFNFNTLAMRDYFPTCQLNELWIETFENFPSNFLSSLPKTLTHLTLIQSASFWPGDPLDEIPLLKELKKLHLEGLFLSNEFFKSCAEVFKEAPLEQLYIKTGSLITAEFIAQLPETLEHLTLRQSSNSGYNKKLTPALKALPLETLHIEHLSVESDFFKNIGPTIRSIILITKQNFPQLPITNTFPKILFLKQRDRNRTKATKKTWNV